MTVSFELGPIFSLVVGWVSQLMGVGLGRVTKWTHGQLWIGCNGFASRMIIAKTRKKFCFHVYFISAELVK